MTGALLQISSAVIFAIGFYLGTIFPVKDKTQSHRKTKTANGAVIFDKDYQTLLEYDGTGNIKENNDGRKQS
ncbi:MAG: hypothetical protein IJJ40_04425 [Clostridia bacterium]|nr:hypothetical protein [Clostridia bacterium]